MDFFEEKVSKETLDEITAFLCDTNENELDYYSCRKAFQLYKKATDEMFESTSSFREAFDKIVSDFKIKSCGKYTYNEQLLMDETNKRLDALYSNFVKNQEVWDKLDMLYEKVFRFSNVL